MGSLEPIAPSPISPPHFVCRLLCANTPHGGVHLWRVCATRNVRVLVCVSIERTREGDSCRLGSVKTVVSNSNYFVAQTPSSRLRGPHTESDPLGPGPGCRVKTVITQAVFL